MDDKMIKNNDEIEIDLQRIFTALLNKAWLIGIVACACALLTFIGSICFIAPKYQSSVMFYVNNSSLSIGDTSLNISSGDISASRGLVKAYIIILNTRDTLNDVIDYAGVKRTYGQVKGMIEAESVDSTEIFRVVVTSTDPLEAKEIADAISYILPKRINSIIEGTSAQVVDEPIVATARSSPNYTKNALIGFLLGFVSVFAVIVLWEIFDITIRTEEDISHASSRPILAAVPDMEAHGKGGYYYGYRKSAYDKTKLTEDSKVVLVGPNISFAASEAYKLLRTKLQFSFTDERSCQVVGVSSSMTGEGKSLTAVNLAYSLSQLGERVLLMDCDMRRPSIADKIPIMKHPGLSEFLSGQTSAEGLIQPCGLDQDKNAFHAISAGRIPPNPMELLSSNKMKKTIETLRTKYDYIILDLPPVGEVGDALAVAGLTDGMLLVVRQNYCNRLALTHTLRQFEFVNTKILGLVFNSTIEDNSKYSQKYYKKYGKRYYTSYYRSYAAAHRKKQKSEATQE